MVNILSKASTAIRWYEPGISSTERKLIFKLDLLILTYASLSFFTKFLDVSALSNAYVSGMKEDIHMKGNALTYVNAVYEACYCVFQIPINMLLTRYPSSIVLPVSEFAWGIATLGTAFVQNTHQLMACRALLGLFAASNYVGSVYIISSWYKKKERGKRMAIFWIANPIGTAVGGWLQGAIYKNKHLSIESWRILFIVCACITVFVSAYGFIALPNLPHNIRSRFLTEDEKKLALYRVQSEKITTKRNSLSWKTLKKLVLHWQAPLFSLLIFCEVFLYYPHSLPFTLWLRSRDNLTIPQVNYIPTGGNAVSLISALVLSWYSDAYEDRITPYVIISIFGIIGNSILVKYSGVSEGGKYFAFFALFFAHGIAPVWQTWVGDMTSHDSELRAYTIAAGNVAAEVGSLVVPILVFQVVQSPRFKAGFIFSLCVSFIVLITAIVIYFLGEKFNLQRKVDEELASATSSEVKSGDIGENSNDVKSSFDIEAIQTTHFVKE